jgi:serine protease Do
VLGLLKQRALAGKPLVGAREICVLTLAGSERRVLFEHPPGPRPRAGRKMNVLLRKFLLASTVLVFASPAAATITTMGKVGVSTIIYDDEAGAGACAAFFHYKGETNLWIMSAYSASTHEVIWGLILRNKSWTWTTGQHFDVVLEALGGSAPVKKWHIRFYGQDDAGLTAFELDKNLINDLANDHQGSFRILDAKGKLLGHWNLDNSAASVRAVVNCLKAHSPVVAKVPPSEKRQAEKEDSSSFGTGFFVATGRVLTNHHVIKPCRTQPKVKYPDFKAEDAFVAAEDEANDLVLLRTNMANSGIGTFRFPPKLGEAVASFGFPYGQALNTSGNFTLGNVTALVGVGDDTGKFQISAPLQPGNSGGPLLDGSGRVIGVSQRVLGTLKMAESQRGAVPQNVNFAISAAVAVNFLNVRGVTPNLDHAPTGKLEPEILAEMAKKFTVQVYCE